MRFITKSPHQNRLRSANSVATDEGAIINRSFLHLVQIALKIALFIATISYPFIAVLSPQNVSCLAIVLAILWLFMAFKKRIYLLIFAAFILIFFLPMARWIYPVLMNLLFLAEFASSLKSEPIITKMARLKQKNLPPKALQYTANLTKIWAVFFAINAILCGVLWWIDEAVWMAYTGIFSYILVGLLLGGEIVFRRLFIYDK